VKIAPRQPHLFLSQKLLPHIPQIFYIDPDEYNATAQWSAQLELFAIRFKHPQCHVILVTYRNGQLF
jgi:hypothetical protein